MRAHRHGELPPGAPGEIRERQGIVEDGREARDLGMFTGKDETLDGCQDAWDAARERTPEQPSPLSFK
jgi:hypothetical protein